MIRRLASLVAFSLVFLGTAFSQDDPVLFSVDGKDVNLSEFNYIYNKNNGDKADYSKASLDEYLDLYTKFKLKVAKAREMGLDTVPRLQAELAGYRKQLASSYLVDKEVSEKLIDEVVERMKTDVQVSHIFFSNPPNASPQKMKDSKERASNVYTQLQQGQDYEKFAQKFSDDKRTALKGGMLGYYVAMLPKGFYEFENAMYETSVGEISKPIQSKLGYHIIKVHDKRPARPEMEVSHILILKQKDKIPVKNAKMRVDSLYQELNNGQDFGKLASLYSEDKNTSNKAGYLGFFRINQYDIAFENAAHALTKDNEYTQPVETELGYHIIKRHSVKDNTDESKLRRKVQAAISDDDRFDIAKKELIEKIKTETGFKGNKTALAQFTGMLDDEFYSYKWVVPENVPEVELIKIDDETSYSLLNFAEYCKSDTRTRLRFNKQAPLDESLQTLYDKFSDEKVLEFEESNLPNKYPEFKALMREYEEGILLFEATKMEVWDKASQDSVGLQSFFDRNQANYKWNERLVVDEYVINNVDKKKLKAIQKKVKKSDGEAILKAFNGNGEKPTVSFEQKTIEKGTESASKYKWVAGSISDAKDLGEGNYSFYKVREIMPVKQKSLKEARGYIIADYQDELEKAWIEGLRKKFKVKVNDKVFNSLIK